MKWLVRDVGGPLVIAIATVGGLVALVGVSWPITVPAALVAGGGWLLVDVLVYQKPIDANTRGGRSVLFLLSCLTGAAALVLAFNAGRTTQGGEQSYLFVSNQGLAFAYGVPDRRAPIVAYLEAGESVRVDCVVDEAPEGRWYRVVDDGGWITDMDFVSAAAWTGGDGPPRCS